MAAILAGRYRRGTGGPVYYFDGVHAGTLIAGNSGVNSALDDAGVDAAQVIPTGSFDVIQAYLEGRDLARANQIASAVVDALP